LKSYTPHFQHAVFHPSLFTKHQITCISHQCAWSLEARGAKAGSIKCGLTCAAKAGQLMWLQLKGWERVAAMERR
jgi:hypothetical protein